jgi:pyroglutamyl-peptidase
VSTLLVTGFEPFGEVQVNPSALIVEHLARKAAPGDVYEVLKTEFAAADERIRQLIRLHQPETVVCLGVAPSAMEIRLERVAANLDSARIPDNAGAQPGESPIVPGGSPTLSATLPLDDMLASVLELEIPAALSEDAGRFVCNHVMYAALDEIARTGTSTRCGFIHVPLTGGALSLDDVITAVNRCIAVARAAGGQPQGPSSGSPAKVSASGSSVAGHSAGST